MSELEYPRSGEPGAVFRYFAWLYSPPPQRELLQTLTAIEAEIAGSLRVDLDHSVSHIRLQWWSDETERFAAGKPVHPLTRALTAPADLNAFLDTAKWDLASATFETRKELALYCERWASAMIAPLAPKAKALGSALRETEMLLNLYRDARAGRLRLPLDEIERAGVQPEAVAKLPWPAPLAGLFATRARALHADLATNAPSLTAPARGIAVWAALAQRELTRAARALPNIPMSGRFEPMAQAWLAWRAARRIREVAA